MANGQPWQSNGAKQVLAAHRRASALEEPRRSGRPAAARTATACAAPAWRSAAGSPGLQPTGATVRLNPDGTLQRAHRPGRHRRHQHRAGPDRRRPAYGVDIDKVRITTGDTDTAPHDRAQRGQQDHLHRRRGGAAGRAGRPPADARDRRRASSRPSVHDLEIEDGRVVVRGVPDRSITLAPIGKKGNLYMSKVPPVLGAEPPGLRGAGAGLRRPARADRGRPGHRRGHAARLRGRPGRRARRSTRSASRARCRAAPCRASGIALTEGLMYDDSGRLMNPSLLDYRKLTAADLPEHRDDHRRGARRRPARSARAGWASRRSCPRRPPSPTRSRTPPACASPSCRSRPSGSRWPWRRPARTAARVSLGCSRTRHPPRARRRRNLGYPRSIVDGLFRLGASARRSGRARAAPRPPSPAAG